MMQSAETTAGKGRVVLLIGLIALSLSGLLVSRLLVDFDWNPTTTIKFGEELPEQVAYAEGLFGEVVVSAHAGHDGKFFFSQAMDPFYLSPETHAKFLDRPTYRAQRMLYPTIAGLGGLLGPTAVAWGLIVVNVMAMGVGTAITAKLAEALGLSPWFGLAFLLNPGMIVSQNIDSADIVATAALMAAVLYAVRDRPLASSLALTASALSRETMILAAIGLCIYWIRVRSKFPPVLLAPFGAVAAWWIYVHWRLAGGLSQDTEALGLPFQGFLEAFRGWLETPDSLPDALIGFVLLFASIAIAVRAVRTPTALGWAVTGFAGLALIISEPVWARYFDSARALAPVLTAYVLLVPLGRRGDLRRDSQIESTEPTTHTASTPARQHDSGGRDGAGD